MSFLLIKIKVYPIIYFEKINFHNLHLLMYEILHIMTHIFLMCLPKTLQLICENIQDLNKIIVIKIRAYVIKPFISS